MKLMQLNHLIHTTDTHAQPLVVQGKELLHYNAADHKHNMDLDTHNNQNSFVYWQLFKQGNPQYINSNFS